MFDLTPIAQAHGIDAAALGARLEARGWDFSTLDPAETAHVDFVRSVCASYAAEIAKDNERKARIEARRLATAHLAFGQYRRTAAAQKPGAPICGKCDGAGTVSYGRHIAAGMCFACKGRGIIRA